MKYALTIFLLLLLWALATMLPIRPGFKELAREIMEHRLEHDDGALVFVEATAIPSSAWEREGEFRLGGNLYDVKDVTCKNGTKFYRCYKDELEVTAEEQADDLIKELAAPNPSSAQGKLAKSLADWLSHLYLEPATVPPLHHLSWAARDYPLAALPVMQAPLLSPSAPPPEA